MKQKVKLKLSDRILKQIKYLTTEINTIEWSGILLYRIESGDIGDIKNFVMVAEYIYPMDIGTGGATEYKFSVDLMDMYDVIPGSDPMDDSDLIIGHVHSHHNMQTFFSSTDMTELMDNSVNHNYYLSLIVNNKMEPNAKLATVGKREEVGNVKNYIKNKIGNFLCLETKKDSVKEIVYIFDVDIENVKDEIKTDQYLIDRLNVLKEKKEKSVASSNYVFENDYYGNNNFSNVEYTNPSTSIEPFYGEVVKFVKKLLMNESSKATSCIQVIIETESAWKEQDLEIYNNFISYIEDNVTIDELKRMISEINGLNITSITNELVLKYLEKVKIYIPFRNVDKYELVEDIHNIITNLISEVKEWKE